MNIKDHFYYADVYLEMAKVKFNRNNFVGARASLAQSYSHTQALLKLIGKLEPLKANVELTESGA